MLDMIGILFSSVIILIVVVRSVQLDSARPWFQSVNRDVAPRPAGKTGWQRHS